MYADEAIHNSIATSLAENGWCIYDNFLPTTITETLSEELLEYVQKGKLRQAGIGRGQRRCIDPEQRSDWIKWLEFDNATPTQLVYLEAMNRLRLSLNRSLQLSIVDYECHLALYPAGGFYKKHSDQFKDQKTRLLTSILYLNQIWFSDFGGQLRLYTDPYNDNQYAEILPIAGRMVTFLSARFAHAVQPCNQNRLSITGFFKTSMPIV
ncbi:MAG: 2OG-Fe(II) oxygenase [Candidatus Thiodiazotropha sp.]